MESNPKEALHNRQSQKSVVNLSAIIDHPIYLPFLRFATTRHQIVSEMIGDQTYNSVLELGCGRGEILRKKVKCFGQYTGLDLSSHQLLQIPEDIGKIPTVKIQECDLDQPLNFPDDSFDLTFSVSTIEYIYNPIDFVREIFRTLKPGGTLILHTVNLAFFPRRWQLLLGKLPTFNATAGWQGGTLHNFTYPTLGRLVRETGFQITEKRCSGLLPNFRMWWPNFLAADIIYRCQKPKS